MGGDGKKKQKKKAIDKTKTKKGEERLNVGFCVSLLTARPPVVPTLCLHPANPDYIHPHLSYIILNHIMFYH